MKRLIILLVVLGLSEVVNAQCDKMFDFKEGTSWQWSNYDKKGKLLGKSMQKVEKFAENGNGFDVTLSMVTSDKKGEQTEPFSLDMSCKDGVIFYDMKKFVPNEYLEGSDSEMEFKVVGDNLELPVNLKTGDVLKDASVTMNMTGSASPMNLNMTVTIFNRKVGNEEVLNTPAGEFNCFIISQSIKTKSIVSIEIDSKEWYSEGTGMIKSENYRKGKMMGYSILTQFSK